MTGGYGLVYPDGRIDQRVGAPPRVGYEVDGYRVDFVRRRGGEVTAFLGLFYGQSDLVMLVFIEVDTDRCSLTLSEAAELAERLRAVSAGDLGSPAHAVAVRLEQLVEEGDENPAMSFLESERTALREALDAWITDATNENAPRRVIALRDALARPGT